MGDLCSYALALISNERKFLKSENPKVLRRVVSYALFFGSFIGFTAYCSNITSKLGSGYSINWLCSFLLGVFFDLLIYEPVIWIAYLMTEASIIGSVIRMIKGIKVA